MLHKSQEGGFMRRPRPSRPYLPTGRTLALPSRISLILTSIFSPFAMRKLEGCCFFFGTEDSSYAEVRAIVVPPQENAWGNYHVSREGTLAVARVMRDSGLVNLAQVHSHPGRDVEHSTYDDAHANSTRAFSLVLPNYGRIASAWPLGIGLHEFQDGYWHLLPESLSCKVLVLETALDLVQVRDLR